MSKALGTLRTTRPRPPPLWNFECMVLSYLELQPYSTECKALSSVNCSNFSHIFKHMDLLCSTWWCLCFQQGFQFLFYYLYSFVLLISFTIGFTCFALCLVQSHAFFFPPSHEFFNNFSIFLISSIGFLDDPCYLLTNTKLVL